MHTLRVVALLAIIGSLPNAVIAANGRFTGDFEGTGRACSGALYVRAKTIEWNSTYSICKPAHYDILEKNFGGDHKRIVFRLKNRSKQCRFEVVEVEYASGYNWNVSGYQSLMAFQKRNSPDWSNSPLPERQTLSCLMTGPD